MNKIIDWCINRASERTTLDGLVILIVSGVVLSPPLSRLLEYVAYFGILYGVWAIVKKEQISMLDTVSPKIIEELIEIQSDLSDSPKPIETIIADTTSQTVEIKQEATQTTTAKPKTTTAKPKTTTAKPKTTTAKPKTTTAKPKTTTAKPKTTTAKPKTTTAKPTRRRQSKSTQQKGE